MDVFSFDLLEEVFEEKLLKVEEWGGLDCWFVYVNLIDWEILVFCFVVELEFQEIVDIMYMGLSVMKMCYKWVLDCLCEKFLDVIEIQLGKYCFFMWEVLINLLFKLCG